MNGQIMYGLYVEIGYANEHDRMFYAEIRHFSGSSIILCIVYKNQTWSQNWPLREPNASYQLIAFPLMFIGLLPPAHGYPNFVISCQMA